MATNLMTEPAEQPSPQTEPARQQPTGKRRGKVEISVQDIITNARTAPASSKSAWLLSGLTGVMLWASFYPLNWGPLAWVALIPMLMLVRLPKPTKWMSLTTFFGGLVFTVPVLQWMRLGDPTMYIAWGALAVYWAMYFPVFLWLSRCGVHRLNIPLVVTAPVVWTALEYCRAHLLTGFAWYFLAHSQHHWTDLIQISDITGTYGVTFLMALTATCCVNLVPVLVFQRLRLFPMNEPLPEGFHSSLNRGQTIQIAVCVSLVAGALIYGNIRRQSAAFTEGPRVALLQGNFVASLRLSEKDVYDRMYMYEYLTGRSVLEQPDIIIWPEGVFSAPIANHAEGMTDEQLANVAPRIPVDYWKDPLPKQKLQELSERAGASLVVGLQAFDATPEYLSKYNSAALVQPGEGITDRYDKIHLVPFGEYLPLVDWLPALDSVSPIANEFGYDTGKHAVEFKHNEWRFVPMICYEDTVPHLVRSMIHATTRTHENKQPVDFLVNLSNDGWFHGSSEHDQHLVTASFRAVECRMPLVRAANMGISAIIDGDGIIREPDVFIDADARENNTAKSSMRDPDTGRFYRQNNAVLVDTIPLDPRRSFYVATGDWFAGSCTLITVGIIVGGFVRRRKKSPEQQ